MLPPPKKKNEAHSITFYNIPSMFALINSTKKMFQVTSQSAVSSFYQETIGLTLNHIFYCADVRTYE